MKMRDFRSVCYQRLITAGGRVKYKDKNISYIFSTLQFAKRVDINLSDLQKKEGN